MPIGSVVVSTGTIGLALECGNGDGLVPNAKCPISLRTEFGSGFNDGIIAEIPAAKVGGLEAG